MKELAALYDAISAILASYLYLVPLLGCGLLWLLCRVKPEFWLAPFNFREVYEDLILDTGPKLTLPRKKELERLREKQRLALHFKNKSERIFKWVYKQESLNISGFNRALLIAYFYPLFLLIGTWLFSDKGVEINRIILLPPSSVFVKLMFLLIPVSVFYSQKIIYYLSFKKLALFSGIDEFVSLLLAVIAAVAAAVAAVVVADGVGAGGVAIGFAVAGAGAVAGALAIAVAISYCYKYFTERKRVTVRLLSPVVLIVAVMFYNVAPWLLTKLTSVNKEAWSIDGLAFTSMFFLCSLPLLNAISDWFSVSFTQFCLRHYESKPKQWWVWILADLLFALVLLVSLFFCIFALLEYMAFWGWQVNPKQMLDNFTQNPFSQQNIWLILLVLTNLAPTILHLVLIATAFLNGWFNPISYRVRDLLKTIELVEGKQLKELEEIPFDARTWRKEDAKSVAFYLVGMPKLNALLILSLACPFFYGAYVGVTEILVWAVDGFLS